MHVFSNFDEIIAKFVQLTPQERAKRKLESLETLRKTFKKFDNDIGVQEFLDASCSDPSVEVCIFYPLNAILAMVVKLNSTLVYNFPFVDEDVYLKLLTNKAKSNN